MHAEGETHRFLRLAPDQEQPSQDDTPRVPWSDDPKIPLHEHEYRRISALVRRDFGLHLTAEKKRSS
jgi:hypothetical protein